MMLQVEREFPRDDNKSRRKTYTTPKLTEWGAIEDLTQSGTLGPIDLGGSHSHNAPIRLPTPTPIG